MKMRDDYKAEMYENIAQWRSAQEERMAFNNALVTFVVMALVCGIIGFVGGLAIFH